MALVTHPIYANMKFKNSERTDYPKMIYPRGTARKKDGSLPEMYAVNDAEEEAALMTKLGLSDKDKQTAPDKPNGKFKPKVVE